MPNNKIVFGGEVLIDLTTDTVTPETLAEGITAHDKSGRLIIGTLKNEEDLNAVLSEQETLIAELQDTLRSKTASGVGDEGTNTQWFADLITESAKSLEVYNDKFAGTLSAYAFYERSNVTKIELPNLQYLKERCFFGCENLKTLLLPNLAGYTYQYMASGCTALVDVDIHGTSYVSSYTFQSCTSLKKLDLHKVGTIGTNAFTGATKFETLILRTDTVPTLGGTNAFTNTKIKSGGTGYIYVKAALLDEFKAATNWSSFASQFRAIEDYPEICGGEA